MGAVRVFHVSVPGELDQVPIKVVPIYLDPVVEEPPLEPEPIIVEPEPRPTRGLMFLGPVALLGGLATAILTGVGTGVAAAGQYETGTVLAWVAIAVSALAVIVSLAAIVFDRGRWWGVGGLVVAVFANPWVLTSLLGLLAGSTA